jgi:hypothetical protein
MRTLRARGWTRATWAALPDVEKDDVLAYETFRGRALERMREALINRETLTPDAAALLAIEEL